MSEPAYGCGMEAVVDLIGGKWKLLILHHLHGDTLRFGELRRLLGSVSEKMLSQQLKEMTGDGLVRRIDLQTVPPHVEYELTTLGLDLSASMKAICDWGNRHLDEIASISRARSTRLKAGATR